MQFGKTPFMIRQAGVSLIEIMVALVIGLLTTLVVMQSFIFFEAQKRTTTGGTDAQTNGAIALYTIARDLQMAGYSLLPAENSPLECNPLPSIAGVDISPVIITDGGAAAGASDTIAIRYGGSAMAGVPSVINAIVGTLATVDNNMGCAVGDVALLINGATCNITKVTAVSAVSPYTVTLLSATGAAGGVSLSCLGTWQQFSYDVTAGNLRVNAVDRVAGIVNIQAQYGISASANSNVVTQWVDATAATGWNTPTVANRNRIKAVRVAVVARSGVYEKDIVSAACSSETAASPTGVCAWDATSAAPITASPAPKVDLSNDPDWAHYRYKVFETIIPLRNTIWSWETL